MREGDVLLMHIGGPITAHAAVYVGDNLIGHHLKGRLSSKEILSDYYKRRITRIIRHRSKL